MGQAPQRGQFTSTVSVSTVFVSIIVTAPGSLALHGATNENSGCSGTIQIAANGCQMFVAITGGKRVAIR